MTELLLFYYGSHPDHRGRMLAEIVAQDDFWFEQTHDFIQWIFPLCDLSRASLHAPLVDGPTRRAFHDDALLRNHMRIAVSRMVKFLGLRFDGKTVRCAENWNLRKGEWFTEHGHNSLRITRVLKSMALLGLRDDAVALHTGLEAFCENEPDCGITAESREFWKEALTSAKYEQDSLRKAS
jgi:hypothetical protein